jgi:hypothetical protein
MALQSSGNAPYAPPSAVVNIINRYRDYGFATPFTLETLMKAGISDSLAPRTLQAMKLLDLIDEDGNPTQEFVDLSKAKSDEYEARLAAVIRAAYAEVFSFVDPATDPMVRIEDAFRDYKPKSQRGRMVSLFLGLCREAGIPVKSAKKSQEGGGERPPRPRPVRAAPRQVGRRAAAPQSRLAPAAATLASGAVPPAILGLLSQLPEPGGAWTPQQRRQFLAAFTAILDLLYVARGTGTTGDTMHARAEDDPLVDGD